MTPGGKRLFQTRRDRFVLCTTARKESRSTNEFSLQHRLGREATHEEDPALLRAWGDWHEQPPTQRQCLKPSAGELLDAGIHVNDVGTAGYA
jgi:hypothetical protein